MASVDDLFKKPSTTSKRKLDISHDPSEYYKSAKHSANGDAKGKQHAMVEDELEDDADVEAGPAPPPDDEEDYGPEDDEDGRFFGSGIDSSAAAAFDYLEEREKEEEFVDEVYDVKWVRSLGVKFEKTINKNQELRSRYESDPQKFMASEADLDSQIKDLSILSEHPELYPDFAEQGCVGSLVSLLAHENIDIAIDAIEAISELIDTDVEATEEQWKVFVDAALDADLLGLLTSNLSRLDELQEADRSGVYNALNILESLASNATSSAIVGKDHAVIKYLLDRSRKQESSISQNKQYAAEVISILLQSVPANRATFADQDAADIILQLLAPYRRSDPSKDNTEEEFVENLFDALASLVESPEGKIKFVEAEGVELCLIMLRESKMAKPRALRILDYATGGDTGGQVCLKIVEKQGLKTIFGMFMKKHDSTASEHILSVFSSMLRTLPGDSAERIRLLAKFMEKDYEKIVKLVETRRLHASKLARVDEQINKERKASANEDEESLEEEWFSRRLDSGLFVLQTIDTILAWLIAEDGGAKKKIQSLLAERDESLADVKAILQKQLDGANSEGEEAQNFREMLATLLSFI